MYGGVRGRQENNGGSENRNLETGRRDWRNNGYGLFPICCNKRKTETTTEV
jgi:hypothetical protein